MATQKPRRSSEATLPAWRRGGVAVVTGKTPFCPRGDRHVSPNQEDRARRCSATSGSRSRQRDCSTSFQYKVEWERELQRRARHNVTDLPPPLPHPDHVVIDMRNGTAAIKGPATREELAQWNEWIARKDDFEQELAELEAMVADPDCEHRPLIEQEIERTRKVLSVLSRVG